MATAGALDPVPATPDGPLDGPTDLRGLLRLHFPQIGDADYATNLSELPIDSFALIELRLAVEQMIGHPVPDDEWVTFDTFAHLERYVAGDHAAGGTAAAARRGDAKIRREYLINMPQMALGGLSESWLFKHLGDLHWEMICAGLKAQSHELADGNGDRLYPTFTRLRLQSSAPLARYPENDRLDVSGHIARLGAGLFFSEFALDSRSVTMKASTMSSFAKRGEVTSNSVLLKGQPDIPADCIIPELAAMPDFGVGYRDRKRRPIEATEFECEYEILPCHDINGVGLLYFAAYPSISEICELKYFGEGNAWARRASVVSRDVCYFANCDITDSIIYRVHARRDLGAEVEIEASLTRKNDGMPMAYVVTRKALLDA